MIVVIALREKLPSLHLQEERLQYSHTMRKVNKIKRFFSESPFFSNPCCYGDAVNFCFLVKI